MVWVLCVAYVWWGKRRPPLPLLSLQIDGKYRACKKLAPLL